MRYTKGCFHFEYYNLYVHQIDKDKQIDILSGQKQTELNNPCDYYYSPAKYYEMNEKNFYFLKDMSEEF